MRHGRKMCIRDSDKGRSGLLFEALVEKCDAVIQCIGYVLQRNLFLIMRRRIIQHGRHHRVGYAAARQLQIDGEVLKRLLCACLLYTSCAGTESGRSSCALPRASGPDECGAEAADGDRCAAAAHSQLCTHAGGFPAVQSLRLLKKFLKEHQQEIDRHRAAKRARCV